MQKCYISSRYSPTVDEWPPYQPRHYTTLALIHHKDKCTDATVISVTQELAVVGKIYHKEGLSASNSSLSHIPNLYSNTTKNISDIFKPVTASDGFTINPCIILIEGAPGIGKTVLAKEIAFQWAKNKLLIDKKILLLLFLRECNFKNIKSIEDLVEYVVKYSEMTKCLTKSFFQTEGKDLAIVFDGYDEISEDYRKSSIIADIIHRRLFAKCCLVITSRPTASSKLRNIVDCRIEIVGFTEEDRLDYIHTALQSNNDQVEALTCYLQSNPTINALCYIPLNMTILLCLVEDGIDKLPKTQTDMYRQFIEMTIVRYILKHDKNDSTVCNNIDNLPDPHKKVLKELAQLAYKTLKHDKIVFTLEEIKKACPNLTLTSSSWNGLGLLKAVRYSEIGHNCVTFHFLHFSIQEYMAAWYISTLSNNKQIKILKQKFWKHRYYNTWIMYVGITCGSSFALRHFLSGNHFHLTTKWHKTLNISNKYLKQKIKCLHLFQCLVESKNEGMTASVSQFFQDDHIDLSNQTLLPSDIITLGFFLIRSINKQWKMLNLAGCNIGSIGSSILCDAFLNNDSRHIITINRIDFSHNQLNFSSLKQLLNLFKSWHTSDIVIIDRRLNHDTKEIYAALEDAFISYKHNVQAVLQFRSLYFAREISFDSNMHMINFENIYLLNCKCDSSSSVAELLKNQKVNNVHLINSCFPKCYISEVCSVLLNNTAKGTNNNREIGLFVYSPALCDQDADEIGRLILNQMAYGVLLVISKSKIQGTINLVNLSNKLSKLELLNLIANFRIMCFKDVPTYPWRQDSCYKGDMASLLTNTLIGLLYTIVCNCYTCHLRIALREKDTLIAHNVSYNTVKNISSENKSVSTIYLSNCDIPSCKYNSICKYATKIYIYNGIVDESSLSTLSSKPLAKEVFIHSIHDFNKKATILSDLYRHSTILVSKNTLIGYKPTTEQVTLALHLEPSINILKLYNCRRNFDIFKQIVAVLVINKWTELHLVNCNIGEVECKILYRHLKAKECFTQLQELDISDNELQTKGAVIIFKALKGISILKKLYISNNSITQKAANDIAAVISCNTQLQELNISNNDLQTRGAVIISKALKGTCMLTKLNISKNNITHKVADNVAAVISCNTQLKEFEASDNYLQNEGAIIILKALQSVSMLTKLCISKNSITYDAANDIAAVISSNTHLEVLDISHNNLKTRGVIIISKALQGILKLTKLYIGSNNIKHKAAVDIAAAISCNSHLKEFDISNNNLLATENMTISKSLQGISTLTKLYIHKHTITDKVADGIATTISGNAQLKELDISDNNLQATKAMVILKALQHTCSLTKLCISKNNTTEKAADDIAAVISCNTLLQELDISENDLKTLGAIKIFKALQSVSTLVKLHISKNNITYKAAYDIAATVSHNTQLQELDISGNSLKTAGAIIIVKALQGICTLTKLYISRNSITDEAANGIAVAIQHNTQLQEFDMGLNKFRSSGITIITVALRNNANLRGLVIRDFHWLTDEAVYGISAVVSSSIKLQMFNFSGSRNLSVIKIRVIMRGLQSVFTLKRLNISRNNITDDLANDIVTALSCNIQLQEFDISLNSLQTPGTIKITKALQQISTLQKFYMNHNYVTSSASNDIAAVCSSNIQLKELDFSKNQFTVPEGYKLYQQCKSINSKIIIRY